MMRAVGLLKPSGRCYTWDQRADGIVFGEACLAVTLSVSSRTDVVDVRGIAVRQDGRTAVMTGAHTRPGMREREKPCQKHSLTDHDFAAHDSTKWTCAKASLC